MQSSPRFSSTDNQRRSPQSNPAAGSTAIHRERDTRSSKSLRKSCRRKFQRKQNDVSPYKNNSVAGFLHVRPTEWVEWYDTYRATYAGPVVGQGQAVPVRPMAAGRQRPANVRSRNLCVPCYRTANESLSRCAQRWPVCLCARVNPLPNQSYHRTSPISAYNSLPSARTPPGRRTLQAYGRATIMTHMQWTDLL